jgi:hypothetical protein
MRLKRSVIAGGLLCLLLGGCKPADQAPEPEAEPAADASAESSLPPVVLRGGATDLGSLAGRAVEAIGRRDTLALEALRLTEHEHNDLVFPRLPAGQPPQNFPVDIAWANIRTRNSVAVLKLFEQYGGKDLALSTIECLGETERFEGFDVATDCWTEFIDADGGTHRVQLFRHVVSADGRLKVFRYYD